MVLQTSPDPPGVDEDVDPDAPEMGGITDPGELQDLRAAEHSCRQEHLDPGSDDGYVRDWRAPALSPERHLSYAGQWLALGLGALAAAIVMAVKAMRRKP